MVDVAVARSSVGQADEVEILEAGVVGGGDLDAAIGPRADVLELGAQDARVQIVEPAVEAGAVVVALALAMVAECADTLGDVLVIGPHRATVTERP